jgi:hypothetical protein
VIKEKKWKIWKFLLSTRAHPIASPSCCHCRPNHQPPPSRGHLGPTRQLDHLIHTRAPPGSPPLPPSGLRHCQAGPACQGLLPQLVSTMIYAARTCVNPAAHTSTMDASAGAPSSACGPDPSTFLRYLAHSRDGPASTTTCTTHSWPHRWRVRVDKLLPDKKILSSAVLSTSH